MTGRFFLGPENSLLQAALAPLLDGVTSVYSPLLLSGPCGSGKSHLAAGLVSIWRQRWGARAATYVSAVDYARQWLEAIETHATDDFQDRYRRAKFLAIDNIDVLATKPSVQQELAETIDALADADGFIVLTCSTLPSVSGGFSARLQSRMLGGLVVPLAPPSRATRLAAVRQSAAMGQFSLPDDAADALADGPSVPLSELCVAVRHLASTAQAEGTSVTARRVRDYFARQTPAPTPTLREIAVATARQFSIRLGDLRSASRRRAVVHARDVAMYLARTLTDKSFEQIGSYFNGRDHSTVSHGCSKTAELLKNDPTLRGLVERVSRGFQTSSRETQES